MRNSGLFCGVNPGVSLGVALTLLCVAIPGRCSRFDGGIPGAIFQYGSGARAMGMGRAFVSIAEGPESLSWNPAGLGVPFKSGAEFTRVSLFEGATLNEFSLAHAFQRPFGVGISLIDFSSGDLIRRDASNNEVGLFKDTRRAALLGYGMQLSQTVSLGFVHRFYRRELDDSASSAHDMDLGVGLVRRTVRGGVRVQNLFRKALGRTAGIDQLPHVFHLGGAARVAKPVLLSLDVVTRLGVTDYRAGVEVFPRDWFAVRAGWDGIGPTLGLSLLGKVAGVHYAVLQHSVLGVSHRVSLSVEWGGALHELQAERREVLADFYEAIAERRQQARRIDRDLSGAKAALKRWDYETAFRLSLDVLESEPDNRKAQRYAQDAMVHIAAKERQLDRGSLPDRRDISTPSAASGSAFTSTPGRGGVPSPFGVSRTRALGVVVGITNYRDLDESPFAASDGRQMAECFRTVLGVSTGNLRGLFDERATFGDLRAHLEAWLAANADAESDVFIYFAGRGAVDLQTGDAYLVPYDATGGTVSYRGYSLRDLLGRLESLPIRRALVILDASFSGVESPRGVSAEAPGHQRWGLSQLIQEGGKVAVLSASSESQSAGVDAEEGQGVLTHFVLRGLKGLADLNGDRRISLSELFSYIEPEVAIKARRGGWEQRPVLYPSGKLSEVWSSSVLTESAD